MADGEKFTLIGGHVALDFANTLDNRFDPERKKELLTGYEDLLAFSRLTGVLKKAQVKGLRPADEEHRKRALDAAVELREAIEEIFSATAQKQLAPPAALAVLNDHAAKAATHRRLIQKDDGSFKWKWTGADIEATAPLWPIALAAAELLRSDDLQYVRECGCETCRWLFLDLSKNHSRRWCDMRTCGNRIKARRFYKRSQNTETRIPEG